MLGKEILESTVKHIPTSNPNSKSGRIKELNSPEQSNPEVLLVPMGFDKPFSLFPDRCANLP